MIGIKPQEKKLPLTVGKKYEVQPLYSSDYYIPQQEKKLLIFTDNKKWEEIEPSFESNINPEWNDVLDLIFESPK